MIQACSSHFGHQLKRLLLISISIMPFNLSAAPMVLEKHPQSTSSLQQKIIEQFQNQHSQQWLTYPNTKPRKVEKLVIFGDSISDTGNLFALLKQIAGKDDEHGVDILTKPLFAKLDRESHSELRKELLQEAVEDGVKLLDAAAKAIGKEIPVIPHDPYFKGRFSNGPNWADWVGQMVLGEEGVKNPEKFINRSYGGGFAQNISNQLMFDIMNPEHSLKNLATTVEMIIGGKLIPPDFGRLAEAYLMEYPKASPNTMYAVFYGANDYLTFSGDAKSVTDSICTQVTSLADNYAKTVRDGSGYMALVNMPDISKTPRFVNDESQEKRNEMQTMVKEHNRLLAQCSDRLASVEKYQGKMNFFVVDIFSALNEEIAKAESEANMNTTDACYDEHQFRKRRSVEDPESTPCSNPDSYLFWDSDHPTRLLHLRVSNNLCKKLNTSFALDCPVDMDVLENRSFPDSAFNP